MTIVKKAVSLVLAVSLLIACSAKMPKARGAFSFQDKPIHPRCISELLHSDSGRLSLKDFHTSYGFQEWKDDPSYLIAEYPEQEFEGRRPYFAYKAIGQFNDIFILATEEWGGGSGRFTNILVVDKSGDELRLVKALGEGDRCNGGLVDLELKGSDLFYSLNITPVDIINLAADEKLGLVAYEDLEASAMSCFASANRKYNLIDHNDELLSVTFQGKQNDQKDWTERFTYQSCFNKVFNGYIDAGKINLDRAGLNEFVREFKKECLSRH
jgi:hypothetical protein